MAVSTSVTSLRGSLVDLSIHSECAASASKFSTTCGSSVRGVGSIRHSLFSNGFLHGQAVPLSKSDSRFLYGDNSSPAISNFSRSIFLNVLKDRSTIAEYVPEERGLNVQHSNGSLPTSRRGFATSLFGDEEIENLKNDDDFDLDYLEDSEGDEPKDKGDPDSEYSIRSLNLCKEIEDALVNRGITKLFPIQQAVLSPAMNGKDVIARAKTGTGKTLAFGIPIIERITREKNESAEARRSRLPRSLVLAPTRELAKQVEREFCESAPNLSTVCVYGGVSIENQIRQIRRGVDVAVGTPGRIIDLIKRGALDLSAISYLVLDEADQMLAVGFEEDVETILEGLPPQRQTSLFSATMPAWVKKLSRKYLNNPVTIDLVGDSQEKLANGIKMLAIRTPRDSKRTILSDLITVYAKGSKTIVFTQTKRDADDVSVSIGRTLGCEALHGDISQNQREKTLQGFRDNRFTVLVATDVAARGLDITDVDLVVHYEAPNDAETFVHRTGRTGRAGKLGSCILMYNDSQTRTVNNIERDVGCKFERINPPTVEDVLVASSQQASDMITRVHPDLIDIFLPAAQSLLQDKGVNALAAAIAHMSGFSQPPPPRSLITFEQGMVTVRVVQSPDTRNRPLDSPRAIQMMLAQLNRQAAEKIGKIRVISDRDVDGAVFDLPEELSKQILQFSNEEISFDIPKHLPRVIEDTSTRGRTGDMYGRFSSQGRSKSSSSRSYANDFPRSRGNDDYSRGRRSNDDYGRSPSFGRSDRSNWDSDKFSSGWASRDRVPSSRRSYSSASAGSYDSDFGSGGAPYSLPSFSPRGTSKSGFGGTCFICKKGGHRAADCPTVNQNF